MWRKCRVHTTFTQPKVGKTLLLRGDREPHTFWVLSPSERFNLQKFYIYSSFKRIITNWQLIVWLTQMLPVVLQHPPACLPPTAPSSWCWEAEWTKRGWGRLMWLELLCAPPRVCIQVAGPSELLREQVRWGLLTTESFAGCLFMQTSNSTSQ